MTNSRQNKANLLPNERIFCKLLAEGSNGVDAYLKTHPNVTTGRYAARLDAYKFKQRIINKIGYAGFLDLLGISDGAITRAHNESLKSTDERVKLSAVKLGYQIRGRLVEQQRSDVNITGDIPRTFTEWLQHDKRNESQQDSDATAEENDE